MKSRYQSALLSVIALGLLGCGASLKMLQPTTEQQRLRNYPRVQLLVSTGTGSRSVDVAAFGGIASGSAKDGMAQVALAAERLAFQLRSIGFEVVDDPALADALAEFSIGAVRYDPLTGWIADEASLVFRVAKDGKTIASIFADTRFVTPRVKTIVERLADAVRKSY